MNANKHQFLILWSQNWYKWSWEVAYDVKDERLLIIWRKYEIDVKIQSLELTWYQKFFMAKY